MQSRIRKYIKILFILQIIHWCSGSNPTVEAKRPLWTWDCVSQRCIPVHAHHPEQIKSFETCNMLCTSTSNIQLWPHPTGLLDVSTRAVPVRSNLFQLQIVSSPSKAVRKYLMEAFELFRDDLRSLEKNTLEFVEWYNVAVEISIDGTGDPRMLVDTDESYALETKTETKDYSHLTAKIYAHSFCGARHALETLLQLIWFDSTTGTLLTMESVKVNDKPRFPYRGLLLDTARNFFPVRDIIRTIDAMAASKLNTFHWHVSDSEAFSLKLTSLPQLALFGAYGSGATYTTTDVRQIVRRARLRGIRVLIEINAPAGVGISWNWDTTSGGSMLTCNDVSEWREYCEVPPCGQLNPLNPAVYHNLKEIYTEIIHLTGVDDLFHIGGDFLPVCWQKQFPQEDPTTLLLEFTRNVLQNLQYVNRALPNLTIMWMNTLSENMKVDLSEYVDNLALQIRRQDPDSEILSGIRKIISKSDLWDLNTGMAEWYEDSQRAAYNSWQKMYEYRPWMQESGNSTLIGGEVTAWSSMLSMGGLDGRLWPRAAAFAERLWADPAEGAKPGVQLRLDAHRRRLLARGVGAAPLWSMWCTHNPSTCS